MFRNAALRALLSVAALAFALTLVGGASGAGLHGIAFSKGCTGSTPVGQPYTCQYQILNAADTAGDTLQITSLIDKVFSASGTQTSGNIIHDAQLVVSGGATCVGGTGSGTVGDPYVNSTTCNLPAGSAITVQPFSFYTVLGADYGLPGHVLPDQADLTWNDLCDFDVAPKNCPIGNQLAQSGSQTIVTQLTSSTATTIHNAAHAAVLTVPVGTTVHDFVSVTGQAGQPNPTGNVTIDWFLNGDCSGAATANSGNLALNAAGQVDATGFSFTVNSAGSRSFRAHYLGDGTYAPSDGPCEPLSIVDANIQITPNGVNRVGTPHTFTGHVNVNNGSGFVNAPDGTQINFAIDSGPGAFVGGVNSCLTTGGTGSCSVQIVSATTGLTTVSASTNVNVGGVALARSTNGAGGNSGPATKLWVDARLTLTQNAVNEVGQPHTFTVTVERDLGSGFQPASAEHVDFTLTGLLGANPVLNPILSTCDDVGPNTNAAGQCTVVFTSQTAGTVTLHALANLLINGVSVGVQSGGAAPNVPDAVKRFVDANIAITPPTATNPTSTNHTFTVTVKKNLGLGGGFVPAAGEHVDVSIVNSGGATATINTALSTCDDAGANLDAAGQCTLVISSPTAGQTKAFASVTLLIDGQSVTRDSNSTTVIPHGPDGTDEATKTWEGGGGEGCTPGYWKQQQHFDSWAASGLTPNQTLASAGFTNTGRPTMTLLQALSLNGGSTLQAAKDILLRAAVAALLNAGSSNVDYEFTTAQVIAMVNAALATNNRDTILDVKDTLDDANNAGCPLN